jgi:DNA-binding MarR family transcriptional regulator
MTADAPTLTIARLNRVLENHAASELTMPQYRVLGLLSSGHERATELASKLAVTKPTLTSLIDGLVDRGYVAREGADGDRRAVRLVITPAGLTAVDEAGIALRVVLDDVLERCADPHGVLLALDDLRLALDARWSERAAAALVAGVRTK